MAAYTAGQRILRNHPIAYVVDQSRRTDVCAHCFQTNIPVKRCARCKLVSYCSAEHQKLAWKDCHKYECDGLGKNADTLTSFMHLVAQTVLKLALGQDSEDPLRNYTPFKRKFFDLASHWSEAEKDPEILQYVQKLSQILSNNFYQHIDPAPYLSIPALGEIYSRVKSNAYAIQGAFNEPVGHGVFLSAGKFDHSCRPNACQSYDGPDMLVYAISEIGKLDEVRVNYTSLTPPTRVRRKLLQEQYFFWCECVGCLDEEHDAEVKSIACPVKHCAAPIPYYESKTAPIKCSQCGAQLPAPILKKAVTLLSEADSLLAKAETRLQSGDARSAIGLLQPLLRDASGVLHVRSYVVCGASLLLSSAYTVLGNFEMAFTFGQNALEGTTFAYPKNHVAVTSHLMQAVRLGLQLPLRKSADVSLFEDLGQMCMMAIEGGAVCTGKDSAVSEKAMDLMVRVEEAARVTAEMSGGHGGCGGGCKHHH